MKIIYAKIEANPKKIEELFLAKDRFKSNNQL
jgi:hypothetical protein